MVLFAVLVILRLATFLYTIVSALVIQPDKASQYKFVPGREILFHHIFVPLTIWPVFTIVIHQVLPVANVPVIVTTAVDQLARLAMSAQVAPAGINPEGTISTRPMFV